MGPRTKRLGTVVGALAGMAIFLGGSSASAAEFKIIANKGVTAGSLSDNELQAIFLGEKSKWDDGKPIKIVVLQDGGIHKAFLQHIVRKTPSQFETYWKKQVFTGKGAAPKSFEEMSDAVDFVAGHAGAVGYVAAGQSTGSAKTISIK